MLVDIAQAISDHIDRVTAMADEAAMDGEQSFSSRASAMQALSALLKELTKSYESVLNMERVINTEKIIIETVRDYLTEEQLTTLLDKLEAALEAQT